MVKKNFTKKIAENIGKTTSELRRASEIGRFLNGIYLLDMQNFENTFNNKYRFSKEKIFFDKIRNIICSPVNYRAYRQHPIS